MRLPKFHVDVLIHTYESVSERDRRYLGAIPDRDSQENKIAYDCKRI